MLGILLSYKRGGNENGFCFTGLVVCYFKYQLSLCFYFTYSSRISMGALALHAQIFLLLSDEEETSQDDTKDRH